MEIIEITTTKNRWEMNDLYLFKFSKGLIFILISILVLTIGFGYQSGKRSADFYLQEVEAIEIDTVDMIKIDNPMMTDVPVKIDVSVMNLLGKSFNEIKQVLGESNEEGYSELFGPHNYLLYKDNEGFLRFCSPEAIENKVAVSIFLGPGEEVQGVKVGMLFAEIEDILGAPDYGPELGMDELYYIDYFIGDTFISFSAESINGSTKDAFVKLENYEYGQ